VIADNTALGLVDASIVAIAERLKVRVLATTDRRHFGAVRPRHVERFTLVP
jgi:predicted nucleic acid-binding protein